MEFLDVTTAIYAASFISAIFGLFTGLYLGEKKHKEVLAAMSARDEILDEGYEKRLCDKDETIHALRAILYAFEDEVIANKHANEMRNEVDKEILFSLAPLEERPQMPW